MSRRRFDPDALAANLALAGAEARSLAPSWRQGDSFWLSGPDGAPVGRMLPGRGVLIDDTLRRHGITKPIPNVFERKTLTWVADRLRRVFASEQAAQIAGVAAMAMAAKVGMDVRALPVMGLGVLQTLNDYATAAANGKQDVAMWSRGSFTVVANNWYGWTQLTAGYPALPAALTAIPGGAAYSRATQGALNSDWTAPGADTGYLHELGFLFPTQVNGLLLIDLLVAAGGISAATNALQTVNTTALTRYTSGVGVQMITEVTLAFGATAVTMTFAYTNSSAVGGRSTAPTSTASAPLGRLQSQTLGYVTALQSGDVGVQSVQSITFGGTATATGAGTCALQLYKPLARIMGVPSNTPVSYNLLGGVLGGVKLLDKTSGNEGPHFQFFVFPNTTSLGQMAGNFTQSRG